MELKETIRFYRRQKNMTQEEMACALGVTTPAVNKWENGSSCPDISLLASLARLLDISLDTLLEFQRELSKDDMIKLIKETSHRLNHNSFQETWEWILQKTHIYPNQDALLWQMAVLVENHLIKKPEISTNEIENQIHKWYKHLLKSQDEAIRFQSANSLFHFYLKKEKYIQAEEILQYFSSQNPLKKQNLALLAQKTGKSEESFRHYEELLFQMYQLLASVFNSLKIMAIDNKDYSLAQYYTEKLKLSAQLFEMGKFHELSCQIDVPDAEKDTDKVKQLMKQMIEHTDTLSGFTSSPLYQHMTFKKADSEYIHEVKQNLMDSYSEMIQSE